MDIKEILKYLPHRYPFLLIDRVLDYTVGEQLHAIKNWNEENTKIACVAVFCGKVRLIDNIVF